MPLFRPFVPSRVMSQWKEGITCSVLEVIKLKGSLNEIKMSSTTGQLGSCGQAIIKNVQHFGKKRGKSVRHLS